MSDLDVGPMVNLAMGLIAGMAGTAVAAGTEESSRRRRPGSSPGSADGQGDDVPPEDQGKSPDEIPGGPAGDATAEFGPKERRLGILLAMAMFVLVVDTSLMNVSISAVVRDLDTTVSGVQSAIALEALVSAAFILIGSRVGDFIGRKKAYVIGLIAYGIGATAMTLAQSLTAVIIFWAIIGGLGASMLLPAMQSLIHGNFSGTAQTKVYALVGAAAAIAAAVGPLLGGFITTFLSWRVGFRAGGRDHRRRARRTSGWCGTRCTRVLGSSTSAVPCCRWSAWAAWCSASWSGRRVASTSACSWSVGLAALVALGYWLLRRRRSGRPTLINPDLFASKPFRLGVSRQMMQQIVLGGHMIALPIYLQMVFEYNAMLAGLSMAPLSLSMFAIALLAGKRAGRRRPECDHRRRLRADHGRDDGPAADRPSGRLGVVPGRAVGAGRKRAGSPRLAAQQLHAVADLGGERQRGRRSQLGRRVLRPVLRTRLRRSDHAGDDLLARHRAGPGQHDALTGRPASGGRRPSSRTLQVMSDTQLEEILAEEPADVQAEVVRINAEARDRALQVALLVPIIAGAVGFVNALRMRRLPDPDPSSSVEGMALG